MTYDEAIASLLETCENLKEAIEQLQEENTFLADTIEKNNLGQIKSERHSLLTENEQCKREAEIAIRKANQIKSDYESKISEADYKLADARKKQSDIDSYIESEAERKIASIKLEYEEHKKANDRLLKRHKDENDKQLQETETFYKERNKKWIVFGIIGITVSIINLLIFVL